MKRTTGTGADLRSRLALGGQAGAVRALCAVSSSAIIIAGGCGSGMSIDARNDSNTTAVLVIERDVPFEDDARLASLRLRPGAWEHVGDFDVGLDRITAWVATPGEESLPATRVRLGPGSHLVIIEPGGDESWSGWTLRVEPADN